MRERAVRVIVPVMLVAVLAAGSHGGWAVVTVEDVPEHLMLGQPTDITFRVRQHGVELRDGLEPYLQLDGGRGARVQARPTGRHGEYVARVTVRQAGPQALHINSGYNDSRITLQPLRVVAAGTSMAPLRAEERGRHLFVAKGCIGCHVNRAITGYEDMQIGPDLTGRRYVPDDLVARLRNPAAYATRGSDFRMPDLELKPAELAALVAFINSPARAAASASEARR